MVLYVGVSGCDHFGAYAFVHADVFLQGHADHEVCLFGLLFDVLLVVCVPGVQVRCDALYKIVRCRIARGGE